MIEVISNPSTTLGKRETAMPYLAALHLPDNIAGQHQPPHWLTKRVSSTDPEQVVMNFLRRAFDALYVVSHSGGRVLGIWYLVIGTEAASY